MNATTLDLTHVSPFHPQCSKKTQKAILRSGCLTLKMKGESFASRAAAGPWTLQDGTTPFILQAHPQATGLGAERCGDVAENVPTVGLNASSKLDLRVGVAGFPICFASHPSRLVTAASL